MTEEQGINDNAEDGFEPTQFQGSLFVEHLNPAATTADHLKEMIQIGKELVANGDRLILTYLPTNEFSIDMVRAIDDISSVDEWLLSNKAGSYAAVKGNELSSDQLGQSLAVIVGEDASSSVYLFPNEILQPTPL